MDIDNPDSGYRELVSDSRIEHIHDWRKSPHAAYRATRQSGKEYMVRCAMCPAQGWGREQTEVVEWPKWPGIVVDIETHG